MDELRKLTRLGQDTPYVDQYAPDLLCPVPRSLSRARLTRVPGWIGYDEWWGFELSWLNARGKPEVRLARFRFDAGSPALIESKSFKLYLNSFNQTVFESGHAVRVTLEADLAKASGAPVEIELFPLAPLAAGDETDALPDIHLLDELDIAIDCYTPDRSLLEKASDGAVQGGTWVSHLLRSNCPVTGQPDWGSVLIHMEGASPDPESLLRYIVSYRTHQGFHEHCVESMYVDLLEVYEPEALLVMARYTRRGGLDINPVRASSPDLLELAARWGRLNRQ